MKPDYDLKIFRSMFLQEMRSCGSFREASDMNFTRWIGENELEIKMYEDFVLLRVPVSHLSREDSDFVYEDALKLVKHIRYIEPNNHIEFISGKWFADFTVDFNWSPMRLVQDIRNIVEKVDATLLNKFTIVGP